MPWIGLILSCTSASAYTILVIWCRAYLFCAEYNHYFLANIFTTDSTYGRNRVRTLSHHHTDHQPFFWRGRNRYKQSSVTAVIKWTYTWARPSRLVSGYRFTVANQQQTVLSPTSTLIILAAGIIAVHRMQCNSRIATGECLLFRHFEFFRNPGYSISTLDFSATVKNNCRRSVVPSSVISVSSYFKAVKRTMQIWCLVIYSFGSEWVLTFFLYFTTHGWSSAWSYVHNWSCQDQYLHASG